MISPVNSAIAEAKVLIISPSGSPPGIQIDGGWALSSRREGESTLSLAPEPGLMVMTPRVPYAKPPRFRGRIPTAPEINGNTALVQTRFSVSGGVTVMDITATAQRWILRHGDLPSGAHRIRAGHTVRLTI